MSVHPHILYPFFSTTIDQGWNKYYQKKKKLKKKNIIHRGNQPFRNWTKNVIKYKYILYYPYFVSKQVLPYFV